MRQIKSIGEKFDAERWNAFYRWVNENKIIEKPLYQTIQDLT